MRWNKKEKREVEERKRKKLEAMKPWSADELALLAKCVNKFPGGTRRRWETAATLGSSGVPSGGVLGVSVDPSATLPAEPFVVKVALPVELQGTYGSTITVSASSGTTVAALKSVIESVTGMGVGAQQVFFGGSELSSGGASLGASGLTSGSTVLLSDGSAGGRASHFFGT